MGKTRTVDVQLTVRLSRSLYRAVQRAARAEERSVAWIIRRLLREYVEAPVEDEED